VEPPELLEPVELGEPAELPDVVRVALLELAVTGLAPPATVPPLRVVAAGRDPPGSMAEHGILCAITAHKKPPIGFILRVSRSP